MEAVAGEVVELEAPVFDVDVLEDEELVVGPAAVAVWTKLPTPMIVTACPSDNEKVPTPFLQSQFPFL